MTTTNTKPRACGHLIETRDTYGTVTATRPCLTPALPHHDRCRHHVDPRVLITERDEAVFEATALRVTEAALRARCEVLERANATLREACEAHAAWSWSEHAEKHAGTTFDERMELCNYAEWLTARALSIDSGDPAGEAYRGVPHMIVWPTVGIDRADAIEASDIVTRVLVEWRKFHERRSAALAQDGGREVKP